MRREKASALVVSGLFATIVFFTITGPIFSFALRSTTTDQAFFSTPVNLSNDSGSARYPNVQSYGTYVYVSWTEEARGIKFRASSDNGSTWYPPLDSPALNLTSSAGGVAQYPLMSANGSNVYVVWSQGTEASQMQIFEATSTNYGISFDTPVQLTSGSGGFITPVIASWGNDVYVGYINNDGGYGNGREAYVICSANQGDTWTRPYAFGNREPQLATYGGQYVYAIADYSLIVSSNNCENWNTPLQNFNSREPWIWAYGPNVYAAWESGSSQSDVYVTSSNNYGQTWSSLTTLNSSAIPDQWAPMVWAYGNSAWIATREYPGGPKGDVWVFTTSNGGETWSSGLSLSGKGIRESAETFPYTVRSSDGENVFVGWSHQVSSGYWTFMVSYSANGGLNWTSAPGINVSQNPNGEAGFENDVATGSISSSGTNCFATWQFTNSTSDQVYFAYS